MAERIGMNSMPPYALQASKGIQPLTITREYIVITTLCQDDFGQILTYVINAQVQSSIVLYKLLHVARLIALPLAFAIALGGFGSGYGPLTVSASQARHTSPSII